MPYDSRFYVTFYFYTGSKYSDIRSESPWNRNMWLCSTLRGMPMRGIRVLDSYFSMSGTGRSTWAPFSGFSGLLRCRWHGILAQAVRQQFSTRESVYWQISPEERVGSSWKLSEPAGWNRIFLPKDDSLAEKLFHPADQRSAADSTLCSEHMLNI